MRNKSISSLARKLTLMVLSVIIISCNTSPKLGIFEGSQDIGNVKHPGSVIFTASDSSYAVTGGGTNMWFNHDEFHFVWKKMNGDVSMTASIRWLGTGGNPHRKACLIIRQSLDSASAYADAVIHGDGLTSLQYRESEGDVTREVQSNISGPHKIRIEKEGDYLSMSVATEDEDLRSSGGTFFLPFREPFYVGLGVCSHNNDTIETAIFSEVRMERIQHRPDSLKKVESTLEVIPIASFDRRVVYHTEKHIGAPNWSVSGNTLIFNHDGLLYSIPINGGIPEQISTGFARHINNNYGISPDGTLLVISDQTETGSPIMYTLPISGGEPRKITAKQPAYWHSWSPDGKMLVYCGERNGNYDIYAIPYDGGHEIRLTTAEGLDNGPDYSADGKFIYFNSQRTGHMKIWRMKTDGSEQQQITSDEFNDWYPHPSPNGKWIAFLSYDADLPSGSLPSYENVLLRLMDLETHEIQVMAKMLGGEGTINVPSWSPDSERLAFVSYRLR